MTRRNLVIVRAGDSSLHPHWLDGTSERSWDILISYFGDDPDRYREPDVIRIDGKGPKWPALQTLIESEHERIERYDYVWLPDDDIECRSSDIDRIFELMRKYALTFAQPALTASSYFTWPITIWNPSARVRYTNFVEIMVPCFEREFLMRCVPSMAENLSGWGLDFLWSEMAAERPRRVAVLDAVRVRHTRPIGSANYKALQAIGRTALQELQEFQIAHGLEMTPQRVEAVVTRGGLQLDGARRPTRAILGMGYAILLFNEFARRRPSRWALDKALRERITEPIEFPPTSVILA